MGGGGAGGKGWLEADAYPGGGRLGGGGAGPAAISALAYPGGGGGGGAGPAAIGSLEADADPGGGGLGIGGGGAGSAAAAKGWPLPLDDEAFAMVPAGPLEADADVGLGSPGSLGIGGGGAGSAAIGSLGADAYPGGGRVGIGGGGAGSAAAAKGWPLPLDDKAFAVAPAGPLEATADVGLGSPGGLGIGGGGAGSAAIGSLGADADPGGGRVGIGGGGAGSAAAAKGWPLPLDDKAFAVAPAGPLEADAANGWPNVLNCTLCRVTLQSRSIASAISSPELHFSPNMTQACVIWCDIGPSLWRV